jgi:hypothetical protein
LKSRLYIVEGLPCSGKSTTAKYISELLGTENKVCFVDEGSGNHPADYEFHSFIPNHDFNGFSDNEKKAVLEYSSEVSDGYIVPLTAFSGELFEKLLRYKIYDFLPFETEKPVMLAKWKDFVDNSDKDTLYIFNCVLLQNPMCETMMRFGFSEEKSAEFISQIAEIIKPMNPTVIYLKTDDIGEAVSKTADEREGWLDGVIDYHVNGGYGKSINAEGFEGYISCLKERQERELRILSVLPVRSVVIENARDDWDAAYQKIKNAVL